MRCPYCHKKYHKKQKQCSICKEILISDEEYRRLYKKDKQNKISDIIIEKALNFFLKERKVSNNFCIWFGIFTIIVIVCTVIYFISNGNSFKNHNNGICDYCSKQSEHHLGNEEFCDDHYIDRMGDIIEWSSEKNK